MGRLMSRCSRWFLPAYTAASEAFATFARRSEQGCCDGSKRIIVNISNP
jgi:hypothetical protein